MKRMPGFTLVEMLIAMALVAILLTIGIPSFRFVTNSNRIAGEINGLLGDMQFARSEAIKEGQPVTICVSTDQATCATGANANAWQSGWIVSDVNGNVLRVQTPFSGTDTFLASNTVKSVTFNREGYATGIANGTLITLHDSTNNINWTRCLSITLVGLMASQKYDGVICN
jgi:type IV fimbrial biogenesis protein FimT